jgi:hypothetical protein
MRLPPALAASATPRILELLGEPPARVLELGFAGIHAMPLRLAGFDVVVVEPDAAPAVTGWSISARVMPWRALPTSRSMRSSRLRAPSCRVSTHTG